MLTSMSIEARDLNQRMMEHENEDSHDEDDGGNQHPDGAAQDDDAPSPKRKRTNQDIILNEDELQIISQLGGRTSIAPANESDEDDHYGTGIGTNQDEDDDEEMDEDNMGGVAENKRAYLTNGVRFTNSY